MECAAGSGVGSKPKVLIVEDNPDLRRLYAIGLNQRGFEVRLAANGADALTRIEQERPDVLLLDLFMPVMDGWGVLARIDADGKKRLPVIIISGQATEPEPGASECIVAWLAKPIGIEELVETIARVVSKEGKPPKTGH
jgi:CheY-like chemotaxis protein